jgi:hypothetical protein
MENDCGSYKADLRSGFDVLPDVLLNIHIFGMLRSVIGYVVSDVEKDHISLICRVKQSKKRLVDCDDEGSTFL